MKFTLSKLLISNEDLIINGIWFYAKWRLLQKLIKRAVINEIKGKRREIEKRNNEQLVQRNNSLQKKRTVEQAATHRYF